MTTTTTTSAGGALAREGGVSTREGGVSAEAVRSTVHQSLSTIVSMTVLAAGEELQADGGVQSTLLPHVFFAGAHSYRVDLLEPHCECRGFRMGGGKVCKHIVAAGVQFMVNDAKAGGIDG